MKLGDKNDNTSNQNQQGNKNIVSSYSSVV